MGLPLAASLWLQISDVGVKRPDGLLNGCFQEIVFNQISLVVTRLKVLALAPGEFPIMGQCISINYILVPLIESKSGQLILGI